MTIIPTGIYYSMDVYVYVCSYPGPQDAAAAAQPPISPTPSTTTDSHTRHTPSSPHSEIILAYLFFPSRRATTPILPPSVHPPPIERKNLFAHSVYPSTCLKTRDSCIYTFSFPHRLASLPSRSLLLATYLPSPYQHLLTHSPKTSPHPSRHPYNGTSNGFSEAVVHKIV
ncbi:unnamed protein product [Periconia digitata]|uniref:Uncharacterized protein n=1 Tax=Periconia digitata TaxID=1303443 RepID=A0A9W4XS20_9PLEO|nr:unnamed protein product [Periconia digitata]